MRNRYQYLLRNNSLTFGGHIITHIPFIILSAVEELDTKVKMLMLGADDYVTKPFEIKELAVRVYVALRKSKTDVSKVYEFHDLIMNTENHEVQVEGQTINLTQHEYKILEQFLMHPDKIYSKQELYQNPWDDYYIGEDKTINVHISNIRQKIKKITQKEYIETIWGMGFRLNKNL